ncbi:MAG: hypothetical protein ACR2RL_10330 [Gammaproteobacteria bacterium]
MLKIREAQMDALRNAQVERYKRELAENLSEQFPQLVERAGTTALTQFVNGAFERAASEGYRSRGPVRLYAQACLVCGLDFAEDAQHRALTQGAPSYREAVRQRTQRLFERLSQYYDDCLGEAASTLARFSRAALSVEPQLSDSLSSERALAAVCELWPAKAQFAGPANLGETVAHALEAGASEQPVVASAWRRVWLAVGFGAHLDSNPLYHWLDVTPDEQTLRLRAFVAALDAPAAA